MKVLIEDPRSKLRGTGTKWSSAQLIFDPNLVFFVLMLSNPAASRGECARWDSIALSVLKGWTPVLFNTKKNYKNPGNMITILIRNSKLEPV